MAKISASKPFAISPHGVARAAQSIVAATFPALAAAIPIIIPVSALSIMLAASQALHLTSTQATSWIITVYGLPRVLSLVFAFRYRQPLMLAGTVFALIFFFNLNR